jgi:hypothetical protein
MTTQQTGRDFENAIHNFLLQTKKMVLREIDVKRRFGYNITGIDHFIEFDNICLCFQNKYQKSTITNAQVGHFITCVNNISDIIHKKCIGIFISNNDLSLVSKQQIEFENNKYKNHYIIIYDSNYNNLIQKLLGYFYNNNLYFYNGDDCIMLS